GRCAMAENLHDDCRDMLCLLNEEQVEYLLIGGWAISFHAKFRYTEDIDLWVRPSQPRDGLHMGVPPCRIDILTTAVGGIPVHVIGREDLLRNERIAGRDR